MTERISNKPESITEGIAKLRSGFEKELSKIFSKPFTGDTLDETVGSLVDEIALLVNSYAEKISEQFGESIFENCHSKKSKENYVCFLMMDESPFGESGQLKEYHDESQGKYLESILDQIRDEFLPLLQKAREFMATATLKSDQTILPRGIGTVLSVGVSERHGVSRLESKAKF